MWTTNNVAISDFPFVQIGFVVAVIVPFVLGLTFPITKRHDRTWGRRFVGILTWTYLGIMLVDLVYAIVSNQFSVFIEVFGWSTLFEFTALAAGFFLLMLFMANKAIADMPKEAGQAKAPEVPESVKISRDPQDEGTLDDASSDESIPRDAE